MDCSLAGSSAHGIFQLRILEWVAISCSRGPSWPRDQCRISCIGRWVLYHWATKEALYYFNSSQIHLLSFFQCLYLLRIVVHLSINYSSFKYFNKRNAEEMQILILNYYAVCCCCCCSVAKSCTALRYHMDCSTPGSFALHYLLKFVQILSKSVMPSEGRENENHNHRKLIKLITWTTALSNSSHEPWV